MLHGTRQMLLILPLVVVWIVFQINHVQKDSSKIPFSSRHRKFAVELLNSTGWKTLLNRPKWTPPDVSDKDYDDDLHEYLKPVKKSTKNLSPEKLWFMKGGNVRPEQVNATFEHDLWPEQSNGDRIVEQLMYMPKNYTSEWSVPSPLEKFELYDSRRNLKKILVVGKLDRNTIPPGRSVFWKDKCPVNSCTLATSMKELNDSDVVVFKGKYIKNVELHAFRKPHQVWVMFLDGSPLNTVELEGLKHVMNWTASYRHDSDIVVPYGKFASHETTSRYIRQKSNIKNPRDKNYATNKTKKVAWIIVNCEAKNDRLQYAQNLSHYIEVDIYGPCGTKTCPTVIHKKCLKILDHYKFYLSFEESNCREYITREFFEVALGRSALPIVMGPPREDYVRIAPPHSFIHVKDFATPKDLAEYLHVLEANDTLYNEYFDWKDKGELINTRFWCRLCALIHSPHGSKSYQDIQSWWSGPGVCPA